MIRPSPVRRAWRVLAAALPVVACFSDTGGDLAQVSATDASSSSTTTAAPSNTSGDLGTTSTSSGTTGTTDGVVTTSGTAATSTGEPTTGPPEPGCGDGVLDPGEVCDDGNTADDDACLSSCQLATCGDGIVHTGVETCDDGDLNHPTLPHACRLDCQYGQCGDGKLYNGPLGPPLVVGGGPATTDVADDTPHVLGVDATGTFAVAWRSADVVDQIRVQRFDAAGQKLGLSLQLLDPPKPGILDPVLAVGATGDLAVAWKVPDNSADVLVRGVKDGMAGTTYYAAPTKSGGQGAPSLALGPAGELVVAYLNSYDGGLRVFARRFPDLSAGTGQTPVMVSTNNSGSTSPPLVAMHATGEFLVAWGNPAGALLYRRFAADGTPAVNIVDTGLRTGGGKPGLSWSAVTLGKTDTSVFAVGRDAAGHLLLRRFDGDDVLQQAAPVDDVAKFYPYVTVASDPWNNVAVAWLGCGEFAALDEDCTTLATVTALRWYYADFTPYGDPETVRTAEPGPLPSSFDLAVAPTGIGAITYREGQDVVVRVSPLQCP